MKPAVLLEEMEGLQSMLQATKQVVQVLRAVHNELAVAQPPETKQREAEQTCSALRAIRPIRAHLKAAIESRDKLMKKHTAVEDGVRSLAAQLQAKQTELEELANALREQSWWRSCIKRVRAEELAEVTSIPTGNAPGGMSAGLATALQVPRQRHSETG